MRMTRRAWLVIPHGRLGRSTMSYRYVVCIIPRLRPYYIAEKVSSALVEVQDGSMGPVLILMVQLFLKRFPQFIQ